jgi:hypothetical protein
MPLRILPPWIDFLRDVDHVLGRSVEIHCLGGFVLGVLYELPRPTGDVDFVEIAPSEAGEEFLLVAGEGSALSRKYGVRFHRVTVRPSS